MKHELIERYFKGQCTQDEARTVLEWIESKKGAQDVERLFDAFESKSKEVPTSSKEKMIGKIMATVEAEDSVKGFSEGNNKFESTPVRHTLPRRQHWVKYAASISLLLGVSLAMYFFHLHSGISNEGSTSAKMVGDVITKFTDSGQRRTVQLADGSTAILNANSSISYPKKFTGNIRMIQMKGEVYFDVAEDPTKPFIVRTGLLTTTALGTSFNIKAEGDFHEVSLLTGKVKVENEKQPVVEYLVPGELVICQYGQHKKGVFDLKTKALWKDGILYFDKDSLKECLRRIESWYGVTIVVEGRSHYGRRKVSGKFDNDYLTNVLNSLSYSHGFDYTIKNKTVTIKFKDG